MTNAELTEIKNNCIITGIVFGAFLMFIVSFFF